MTTYGHFDQWFKAQPDYAKLVKRPNIVKLLEAAWDDAYAAGQEQERIDEISRQDHLRGAGG
jgi:hypothetical protein